MISSSQQFNSPEPEHSIGVEVSLSDQSLQIAAPSENSPLQALAEFNQQELGEGTETIQREYQLPPLAAGVLAARGYSADDRLSRFLNKSMDDFPSVTSVPGIQEAAAMLLSLRSESTEDPGPLLAILSDYDVDGATSAVQLALLCDAVGIPYVLMPTDRFDGGYGLTIDRVERVYASGAQAMIALDIGTRGHEELVLAGDLGIQSIICDHHEVSREKGVPESTVFVNPKSVGGEFEGGGVCASFLSYCLTQAVREQLAASDDPEEKAAAERVPTQRLMELATCGTVADIMELQGINRAFVTQGLQALSASSSPGMNALKKVSGVKGKVTAQDIGFQIGPRINAMGRIVEGDEPGIFPAIRLFLTDDPLEATALAGTLQQENLRRRKLEREVVKQARLLADDQRDERGQLPEVLILQDDSFHAGVVGIAASRLMDEFKRPVILLCAPDVNGVVRGSGRAPEGIHLLEALESTRELLKGFGGHAAAAGLGVHSDELALLQTRVSEAVRRQRLTLAAGQLLAPADLKVSLADLTSDPEAVIEALEIFEPCGHGNPAPSFLISEVTIVGVAPRGQGHLELLLRDGVHFIKAFLWRPEERGIVVRTGDRVSVIAERLRSFESNFDPRVSPLQLSIRDLEFVKK